MAERKFDVCAVRRSFPGSSGTPLAGRLDVPDAQPQAFALFAHCFTCSKDVLAASRIAQALTGYGIAVLRFDFTGLGGSDGEFANTNVTSNVADLVNAADYLRNNHTAPTILVDHSLGGAAVLAAAEHIPEARVVATIGAPAGTEHLLHLLDDSRHEIEENCLRIRKGRAAGVGWRCPRGSGSDPPAGRRPARPRSTWPRCLGCTRPPTRRWASTTPASSSAPPATPSRSSPPTAPTTCSPEPPTPASLPGCWRPGRAGTSTRASPRLPRPRPPRQKRSSRGWSSCPRTVEARTANASLPADTC